MARIGLHQGDCLEVLKSFPDEFIDTCITDPPYGLNFMGKEWDADVPGPEYWEEVYRVLKPGAFLLCFAGTRTSHWMAVAIEKAGFEIRDTIQWIYGDGFPKNYNIGKGLDKHFGKEREVIGYKGEVPDMTGGNYNSEESKKKKRKKIKITRPATKEARKWEGYGTALMPAHEPIIVAMKPRDGTFVNNALEHGVSGLNIEGSRFSGHGLESKKVKASDKKGRYPANLILQHHPDCEPTDEFITEEGRVVNTFKDGAKPFGGGAGHEYETEEFPDDVIRVWECHDNCPIKIVNEQYGGNASKFFYNAKASKKEKTLDGKVDNNHPTVKPVDLMSYLCTLTKTPDGGIVLDPFMGSGSTGVGCIDTDRDFLGIEMDEEYFEIAKERINIYREEKDE